MANTKDRARRRRFPRGPGADRSGDDGLTATRRTPPGRLGRLRERIAFGNPFYHSMIIGGRAPSALAVVPPDPWPGDPETGNGLLAGIYHHAGQAIGFIKAENGMIHADWSPEDATPAWFEALHGFGWLRDLRAVGGDAARRRARALALSWINQNGHWNAATWAPEVIGARVASWIAAHDFFCASADNEFRTRVFDSLARQTRHLARVLPADLTGHELLTALHGMAMGGLCLPGQERVLVEALRRLERELSRQVLSDGGHVERNPSIQLRALRRLIDLRAGLRAARIAVPDFIQIAIDRMTPALRFFRHGDGGLALFNGGREEDPALIDAVLSQADSRGRSLKSALHSGFERMIAGKTLVVMDAGSPPPEGMDARAHAGTLSIEISSGRERLIVNCGAYPGRSGPWRSALAATAAHSTLTIAETNSSEVFESGGLGRRPTHVGCERQEIDGAVLVAGGHNGYGPNFGFLHRRRVFLTDNGDDIRGEDVVEPVLGTEPQPRNFAVRFHLHPSVHASLVGDGPKVELRPPSGASWRFHAVGGDIGVTESVYHGTDDEPRRTTQIVVTASAGSRGAIIKWGLRRVRPSE